MYLFMCMEGLSALGGWFRRHVLPLCRLSLWPPKSRPGVPILALAFHHTTAQDWWPCTPGSHVGCLWATNVG